MLLGLLLHQVFCERLVDERAVGFVDVAFRFRVERMFHDHHPGHRVEVDLLPVDAEMTQIAIGVGTYNPGQEGYIDQVVISHSSGGGYSGSFDFDVAPLVPLSSAWGAVLMGAFLLVTGSYALRGHRLPSLKLARR